MGAGGSHALGVSRVPEGPTPPPTRPALAPSYAQRLELLVLKEDFFPRLSALRSSIQTLTDAAAGERHHGVGGGAGGRPSLPPAHPSAILQSCWSVRSCTPSSTSSSVLATT